nr:hypothetical protein GCM10020092_082890 [Actinoplanes digitatis]
MSPRPVSASTAKAAAPATEVTKVVASAAGATTAIGMPRPSQDGTDDGSAADAVDAADHPDAQRQRGDPAAGHRGGTGLRHRRAQAEPHAEGQQQDADDEPEHVRAGHDEDPHHRADDHARQGADQQQPGQRAGEAAAPAVPQQGTRAGDDVEQQIRRRHRRIGYREHAELDREQEHRAGDADRGGDHRNDQSGRDAQQGLGPCHGWNPRTVPGAPKLRHAVR